MSVRFMRNRKTGVVFAWNEKFARHPDIEEIDSKEALAVLKAAMEQRARAEDAREKIANPEAGLAALEKAAAADDNPSPPPMEEAPKARKKKKVTTDLDV